jgi:hypothetical protein
MNKAQDFIKEFAPECIENNNIPYEKVLALMESFASKRVMTQIEKTLKDLN